MILCLFVRVYYYVLLLHLSPLLLIVSNFIVACAVYKNNVHVGYLFLLHVHTSAAAWW